MFQGGRVCSVEERDVRWRRRGDFFFVTGYRSVLWAASLLHVTSLAVLALPYDQALRRALTDSVTLVDSRSAAFIR